MTTKQKLKIHSQKRIQNSFLCSRSDCGGNMRTKYEKLLLTIFGFLQYHRKRRFFASDFQKANIFKFSKDCFF